MLSWDEFDEEDTTTAQAAPQAAAANTDAPAKLDKDAAGSVEEARAVAADDSAAVARAKKALDDLDIQEGAELVVIKERVPTVLTASGDKTAKLWDANTGELLHTLRGHTTEIVCLAFDPTGAVVATGSMDSTAKLWSVEPLRSGE